MSRWGRKHKAALFAVASALGCSPSADFDSVRAIGVARSPVQGGEPDTSHAFAVAIVSEDAICSGTLIAPNLVLTARHCISFSGGESVDCEVDRFGRTMPAADFRVTTDAVVHDDSRSHAVAEIFVPEVKQFCGGDIALLRLEDLVDPSEATPVTPAVDFPLTDSSHYGSEVSLIGYGITAPRSSDDGTRRRRDGVSIVCVPGHPTRDCGDLSAYDMTSTEFVIPEGVCTGDSGSSAFDQASLRDANPIAIGVLSRASETRTQCTEAIYTRTDSFKDFIIESAIKAAEVGGYPAPTWTGVTPAALPPTADAGDASGSVLASSNVARTSSSEGCAVSAGASSSAWPAFGAALFVLCWGRAKRRSRQTDFTSFRSNSRPQQTRPV